MEFPCDKNSFIFKVKGMFISSQWVVSAWVGVLFLLQSSACLAQETTPNGVLTLQQCIDYALVHQPALNQSQINLSIAKTNNAINLSGWYPQVNAAGTLTHYQQLPTGFQTNPANPNGPPVVVKTGIPNTASPGFSATQTIFNPTLIYAAKSAQLYIDAAKQVTDSAKIYVVASVSKAFYSLLLTLAQIDVLKADTTELRRSVTDAFHQYKGGIVDETDYEEATITLNNTLIQLRQAQENLAPQYALLKQTMGYPSEQQFNVSYDTSEMIRTIQIDSTEREDYEHRIEFRQLQTAKKLQKELIHYYRLSFLPSLNGFYNYTYQYGSSYVADLFNNSYPYSSIGLSLNWPLFTGFARTENIRKARLQDQLLEWSEVNLKSEIYTEYVTALAAYKSSLYNFKVMSENVQMAKRVYFVVELQYRQGIVAYLNVITAQSNLITSETGYNNALFQTLLSKIDLEKAMGNIKY